jgi:IclR family transcriptional regulator, acetate operon repressor
MALTQTDDAQKTIRSIERSIDVLACFDQATPQLSVTDLQKRTGLSRPTLYRILATLEGKGVIRSFGDPQRFELGHEASRLAANWIGQDDFVRAARPVLRRLWDDTDETVALFIVAEGAKKICIEELQSRKALTFTRGVGFTEDLAIGASGKTMLAFTKQGATTPEFGDIRDSGVCVSEGEIIEGAVAIAAPVFERDGSVKGSVCIFGPAVRLSGAHRNECIDRVRRASEEISYALGYTSPADRRAAE